MIKFTVPGKPQGKARPRHANGVVYTPQKTKEYEELVRACYLSKSYGYTFGDDDIAVQIAAYYAIPKNTSKKRIGYMLEKRIRPDIKPDLDNVAKAICDALNGVAYDDDKQVVELNIVKFYSETPRVEVGIETLF